MQCNEKQQLPAGTSSSIGVVVTRAGDTGGYTGTGLEVSSKPRPLATYSYLLAVAGTSRTIGLPRQWRTKIQDYRGVISLHSGWRGVAKMMKLERGSNVHRCAQLERKRRQEVAFFVHGHSNTFQQDWKHYWQAKLYDVSLPDGEVSKPKKQINNANWEFFVGIGI